MGDNSVRKVVGSNPVYWMDMIFSHLFVGNNCIVCLKRAQIKEKEAKVGPFKKVLNVLASLFSKV